MITINFGSRFCSLTFGRKCCMKSNVSTIKLPGDICISWVAIQYFKARLFSHLKRTFVIALSNCLWKLWHKSDALWHIIWDVITMWNSKAYQRSWLIIGSNDPGQPEWVFCISDTMSSGNKFSCIFQRV